MKIKEEELQNYQIGLNNNQDPYGRGVYTYLERWAELMERAIENNPDMAPEEVICKYARDLSHEADTEGITGFMYGCAVSILAQTWAYGDMLKKWHNGLYEYEGQGVVNPAIFTVSTK